ncbi:MAG TPA: hypothetical protein VMH38_02480 [Thermoplasmata archaeon]|nr:hypothetical protein [Thermoplasmata archaeon]
MTSTETLPTVSILSPPALDVVAFVLFALFASLLLLGYIGWYPGFPFTPFAAVTLAVALASLFWANVLAEGKEAPSLPTG